MLLCTSSNPGSRCRMPSSKARRFRAECLNEEWFVNLAPARAVIEAWRVHYHTRRPHSALGYQTPAAYLATRAASPELPKGSAQLPLSATITPENSQSMWP